MLGPIIGPLLIGVALGALTGLSIGANNGREKSIVACVVLAFMYAFVCFIVGVPVATAIAFFAGNAVTALGAVLVGPENPVTRFFKRAFEESDG